MKQWRRSRVESHWRWWAGGASVLEATVFWPCGGLKGQGRKEGRKCKGRVRVGTLAVDKGQSSERRKRRCASLAHSGLKHLWLWLLV